MAEDRSAAPRDATQAAADRVASAMLYGEGQSDADPATRGMRQVWDDVEHVRHSASYADLLGSPTLRERAVDLGRRSKHHAQRFALPAFSTAALATAAAYFLMPQAIHYDAQDSALQVTLPDRTALVLAPHSRVDFERKNGKRLATLVGEAQLSIAHDTAHPFLIQAGEAQVRVVGTRFTLAYRRPCTQLSVLSGTVAIHSPSMATRLLNAGEATINVDAGQSYRSCFVAPGKPDAMRISYVDVPLSLVIADLERFYPRKIRIKSARVAKERVTMSFGINEVEDIINVVPTITDSRIYRSDSGEIILDDKQ